MKRNELPGAYSKIPIAEIYYTTLIRIIGQSRNPEEKLTILKFRLYLKLF